MIEKIYEEEFAQYVLQANYPVVVDFYADWCGPCKMLAPILEQLERDNDDFGFYKVNVDENPELAVQFGVMTIPTLMVMDKGQVLQQAKGAMPKRVILKML